MPFATRSALDALLELEPLSTLRNAPRPFAATSDDRTPPNLLVNGCGRSGTHAVVSLLRRHGVKAMHEGRGHEATVGRPYVGRTDDWRTLWPMAQQPHADHPHDPIFKVHRHPLPAILSIAAAFTSSGGCRGTSERRWDARAWRCASRFVSLPVEQADVAAQTTCAYKRPHRLKLALHYWVKWNLLADKWATHTFPVESFTMGELAGEWCGYCARSNTCKCSPAASAALANRTVERVRPRKGHDPRKLLRKTKFEWAHLEAVDPGMARVARLMAEAYGYDVANVTAPIRKQPR